MAKMLPVICVLCPDSCLVKVFTEGEGDTRRGIRYTIREVADPRRTFTSTVRVLSGDESVCPVRTTTPIRKDDWKNARKLIGETMARASVRCGGTLVVDFL